MNPTPEEIIQTAKTPNGEMVKTVTDLRIDKLEAQINELIKINEELRAANKELYAVASQAQVPQQAAPAQPEQQMTAAAAVSVRDPAAEQMQKARDDALLAGVLAELGYRKAEPSPVTTSQFNNEQKDGM